MRLGFRLGFTSGSAQPYAGYPLAADFDSSHYRDGSVYTGNFTRLPGSSYLRSGQKTEVTPHVDTDPYAGYALAFDPDSSQYREHHFYTATLPVLSLFTYTRPGAKTEVA